VPGDQLILTITPIFNKRGLGKFKAIASVEGQVAAEAEIMCTMRDK
jgi:3-hydroxyacyl-[acyl-carrier-protein] dehydratase